MNDQSNEQEPPEGNEEWELSDGSYTTPSGSGYRYNPAATPTDCLACNKPDSLWFPVISHSPGNLELSDLFNRGIVPFKSIDDGRNQIPLCSDCSHGFKNPVPWFIIVPRELEYFISFEKADFERRMSALDRFPDEEKLRRIVPSASSYHSALMSIPGGQYNDNDPLKEFGAHYGLYDIYIRIDPAGEARYGKVNYKPHLWHGSPSAMILHAAKVMGHAWEENGWLDEDVGDELYELIRLWRKEPSASIHIHNEPISQEPTEVGFKGSEEEVSDSISEARRKRLRSCTSASSEETAADTPIERWRWGPTSCSNDVITFALGARSDWLKN